MIDVESIKHLEEIETMRRMLPRIPVVARLDGRAFHTFTRDMSRPYDEDMQTTMEITTKELVGEFHALVGYTQSDEISLVWDEPILFDGRLQKLTSVLAGYASSVFAAEARAVWPNKRMVPCFDCRVWQVPTLEDAVSVLAWREDDATRNSVSMAAQSVYSHKELHKKGRGEMMDMLHAKGINWNDYPMHFKRGIYVKRKVVERMLTRQEWQEIPEAHRPPWDQLYKRGEVQVIDLPPIRQIENPVEVLFTKETRE